MENRFHDLSAENVASGQHDVDARWRIYSYLSSIKSGAESDQLKPRFTCISS